MLAVLFDRYFSYIYLYKMIALNELMSYAWFCQIHTATIADQIQQQQQK